MKKSTKINILLVLSLLVSIPNLLVAQTNFIYGKQFGSDKEEVAYNPVFDRHGNVYIGGETKGSLSGKSVGNSDGFVTKLDSIGNIVWTKQFGTTENDVISWINIDSKGNIYAVGNTKGRMGEKNFGNSDILLVKLDGAGNIAWQKQYGSDSTDVASNVYINNEGSIYVAGATKGKMGKSSFGKTDGVVLKIDSMGNVIWTKQFGTAGNDECLGITGEETSNIYVCGYTSGDLAAKNNGITDAFISKFTADGKQVKTLQFGTSAMDIASNIALDKNKNIYLGGYTSGNLEGKNQGEGDSFLSKINENLEISWTKQFGTAKWDGINGIALSEKYSDAIIVSGCQNWPSCQSFIRIYKTDGSLVSTNQFIASGKNGGTCGKGVGVDASGNIYHTGNTGGSLFKSIDKPTGHDLFLMKLSLDKTAVNP